MKEYWKSSAAQFENRPIYQYIMLTAITLLAAFLRFYQLGEWSLWSEEMHTLNRVLAHYGNLEMIVRTTIAHKFVPLSIIFTGGAVNLLGASEWTGRLIPTIIGVLTVPILYFPIRKLFNWRVALLVSFLLAISTWHIFWSQNARFYTSLLLFYTLSLFLFYFAVEFDRPLYVVAGYFFLFLAASERLIALLAIPVFGFYLGLLLLGRFEKPVGFRARNVLLFILLPLFGLVFIEGVSLITSGATRFLAGGFFSEIGSFISGYWLGPRQLLKLFVVNMSFPVLCLAAFGSIYLMIKRDRAGLFMTLVALFPLIVLLLISPFTYARHRYLFITLFGWLVLASIAVIDLVNNTSYPVKLLALGVMILLIGNTLGSDFLYFTAYKGIRSDVNGAVNLIKEQALEDDAVIFKLAPNAPKYLGVEEMAWEEESFVNLKPEMITGECRRFWFAVDERALGTNIRMKKWLGRNADLIDVLEMPGVRQDLSLPVYLYDPWADGRTCVP